MELGSFFYQGSYEEYGSVSEWEKGLVDRALPPGPARDEARAFLDHILSGPLSDKELKAIWEATGPDYNSNNPRAFLQSIRDAFDAPYVKPKL